MFLMFGIDILDQDLNKSILIKNLALRFFLLNYKEKFRMTKLFYNTYNPNFHTRKIEYTNTS